MQQAVLYIRNELYDLYSENELQSVSRLIISNITGFTYTEILVNKNTIFSEHQREILKIYLEKLKSGMPVQYVLGETEFCGLKFRVDDSVLIPRPETEELVNWVVEEVALHPLLLDVGTGSGCIAVSIKKMRPDAEVHACDISARGLLTARANAAENEVNVRFFEMDILKETDLTEKYHVIVSNPPYIPISEKDTIETRVKDFEPEMALFVPDDDPLLFYRKIAMYAQSHLYTDGKLFFEVHRDYGNACVEMLKGMDSEDVLLRKDIAGNDRMVRAKYKKHKKK